METNREKAIHCSDSGGDDDIRMQGIFYALLAVADAIEADTKKRDEGIDLLATWLERICFKVGGL